MHTAINYARHASLSEKTLSTISNYFYLGGTKVTVIKGDEVQVEAGQVAWYEAAVKVVSYILFFPLTLTLVAVSRGLRSGHNFTVLSLPQPVQTPVIAKKEPKPPAPAAPMAETAQAIKVLQPATLIAPPSVPKQEEIFHPFAITISGESLTRFDAKNEMLLKAQELGKQVLSEHCKLQLAIRGDYDGRKQAQSFIEELKNYADVVSWSWCDLLSITPKKSESSKDGLLVRTYTNGIVEEVDSSRLSPTSSLWYGKRIYPNGVIESGRFDDFIWYSGTRVEQERTLYRRPNVGMGSNCLNRYAVRTEIDGVKQIMFLQKWLNTGNYVQIKDDPIPTFAAMLKKEYCPEEFLREVLSGPIDCEQFIQYLFHENIIFHVDPHALEIILKLVQENKFTVNLRQQNPDSNETLLTRYSSKEAITQAILAIDPTLCDEAEPILVKQFKKKMNCFSGYRDDPSTLFKQLPKSFALNEAVEYIFTECFDSAIIPLLHSFLNEFPSYRLSGCDTIRRAIVEDEKRTLTNEHINNMFKEHNITGNNEEMASCYDLAYRLNHPNIYPVAGKTPLPNEYTINFLWINLNPQDRIKDSAEHIFKDGLDPSENADTINDTKQLQVLEEKEQTLPDDELESWMKIKTSYAYRLAKWAEAHPGAQINLWYDSALVTEKARAKTTEMLKGISQSRGVNLRLRDLRRLPQCTGEIENIFHPGTPVYLRVDLLKVLIADQMLCRPSVDTAKYCVVTDIDVEPMTPQYMFDQRTVDYLSKNGYVFNRVGFNNFENSFFIFNKENDHIQKAQQQTIIRKIESRIAKLREYPINKGFRSEYILASQSVFNLYTPFREEMGEEGWGGKRVMAPRKIVQCPRSQFFAHSFTKSDHQEETFRFIGDDNVPYTRFGRNNAMHGNEGQIKELQNWTAEPLPPVQAW